MKIFKSIAVRAVALLLFFAMIAAVILYQAGAYDLSFIDRPLPPVSDGEPLVTEGDTDTGDITDPTDTTDTSGFVETLPTDEETMKSLLAAIPTLSELSAEGYAISADRFGRRSLLAKYENTFGVTDFSQREETVSKTILVKYNNGLYGTQSINVTSAVPRIRFYFGLILVENGRSCTIYNQEGKEIVKSFTGTLPMARSKGGLPVVRIGTGYYVIDPDKGIGEMISEEQVDFKALSFDHPLDYAVGNSVELYPFSAYVDIFTYVGEKPKPTEPTTESSEDDPPETDPEETTDGQTTGEETTAEETTAESTTAEDTDEQTTTTTTAEAEELPAETTTAEAEDGAEPAPIAEEEDENGGDQEDGEGASEKEEATTSETESETESEPETSSEEQTTQDPMIPVNGTVEIDGYYYKVTQELRWGYRDADGNVVIEPQYHSAYSFTEDGLAAVTDGEGNLFFINTSGQEVVTLRNQIFVTPPDLNYTRYRQYYVDSFQRDLSSIGMYYYDDGYVMVRYCRRGETYVQRLYLSVNRLIDTSGREYTLPNGYALEGYSDGVMLLSKNGKYGYMNTAGGWVSPAVYTKASPFLQGLAVAVDENGKYGMIDTDGNIVLPFYFEYISDASGGMIAAYSETDGWQLYCVVEK